jgi:hypothetical protein
VLQSRASRPARGTPFSHFRSLIAIVLFGLLQGACGDEGEFAAGLSDAGDQQTQGDAGFGGSSPLGDAEVQGEDSDVEISPPGSSPLTCSRAQGYEEIGTTTAYNGDTHLLGDIEAPCRALGARSMVFVADDLYGTTITQDVLSRYLDFLEVRGWPDSDAPEVGIIPNTERLFGALRSEDFPEGKLPIFVFDTDAAGDGYMCQWCAHRELHLDGVILDPLDSEHSLAITAHELFHAIHRGIDADETFWVDEVMGQASMIANGLVTDADWLLSFLDNPNVNWGPGTQDPNDFQYGAGLLLGAKLWEVGGADLMWAITHQPKDGWEGLDAALLEVGVGRSSRQVFQELAVALYIDDPARGYGLVSLGLPKAVPLAAALGSGALSARAEPYGITYYPVPTGCAAIELDDAAASVVAQLVLPVGDSVEVLELSPGEPLTVAVPEDHAVLVVVGIAGGRYSVSRVSVDAGDCGG